MLTGWDAREERTCRRLVWLVCHLAQFKIEPDDCLRSLVGDEAAERWGKRQAEALKAQLEREGFEV